MFTIPLATQLSNDDLVSSLAQLAAEGRHRTADLIALLVALQSRSVHVEAGYTSLFRYCVDRLRLSEEETFYRLAASRVAARLPVVLEWLREGRLTLTTVALLRKHLTEANHLEVLGAAEGRTKREVQALVARLAPRPDVPVSLRKLPPPPVPSPSPQTRCDPPSDAGLLRSSGETVQPTNSPGTWAGDDRPVATALRCSTPTASEGKDDAGHGSPILLSCQVPPARPALIMPLSPGRYSLRLTISEETQAKLRRAHELLAPTVPPGDTAAVLDRALTLLVAQLERRKYAALRPRSPERQPRPARRRASRRATPAAATRNVPTEEPAAVAVAVPAAPMAAAPAPAAGAAPATTRRPSLTRYIPAAVRREVWQREGGRCAYVAPNGTRCGQTAGLQFHHTLPVADGGAATARLISLRCRDHHAWETRRWFGEEVARYRGHDRGGGAECAPTHPGWP